MFGLGGIFSVITFLYHSASILTHPILILERIAGVFSTMETMHNLIMPLMQITAWTINKLLPRDRSMMTKPEKELGKEEVAEEVIPQEPKKKTVTTTASSSSSSSSTIIPEMTETSMEPKSVPNKKKDKNTNSNNKNDRRTEQQQQLHEKHQRFKHTRALAKHTVNACVVLFIAWLVLFTLQVYFVVYISGNKSIKEKYDYEYKLNEATFADCHNKLGYKNYKDGQQQQQQQQHIHELNGEKASNEVLLTPLMLAACDNASEYINNPPYSYWSDIWDYGYDNCNLLILFPMSAIYDNARSAGKDGIMIGFILSLLVMILIFTLYIGTELLAQLSLTVKKFMNEHTITTDTDNCNTDESKEE